MILLTSSTPLETSPVTVLRKLRSSACSLFTFEVETRPSHNLHTDM